MGLTLGRDDGKSLGCADGIAVGLTLGNDEGAVLGASDGLDEG